MKKIITLFLSLNCINVFALDANSICSKTGAVTICGAGALHDLQVAGKAILTGTSILNFMHVAGMLKATSANFNYLKVAGFAKLDQSTIAGETKISGMLCAHASKFDVVNISSDKSYLNAVSATELRIDPGGQQQILCLSQHSMIKGNITFSSGHGLVVMDDTSRVDGTVIGGKLEFNNKELCGSVSCWI